METLFTVLSVPPDENKEVGNVDNGTSCTSTFHTSHTQTLICLSMSQKEIQNICLLKKVSLHSAPRLQCKLRQTVCPSEAGTILCMSWFHASMLNDDGKRFKNV